VFELKTPHLLEVLTSDELGETELRLQRLEGQIENETQFESGAETTVTVECVEVTGGNRDSQHDTTFGSLRYANSSVVLPRLGWI
jgi:hypothetical protein